MSVETVEYVVKKQDSLWNIVKQHGFPPKDWKRVYEAPYNRQLRKQRPDPNVILPGDRVSLPRYNPKQVQELLQRITSRERQLAEVSKDRKGLLDHINKVRAALKKLQEPDKREIERLTDEADALHEMADSIIDDCEGDPAVCGGLVFVQQNSLSQARELNKKASSIARRLRKERERFDSTIEELGKTTEQLRKAEDRLLKDIQAARTEWKKASVNPY